MSQTSFRNQLAEGKTLVGTLTTIPHPAIQEMLALAGFDWLFIDGEHAPLTTTDVAGMVRATNLPSLVRIPEKSDEQAIKSALDCGAAGVIAPLVNTAEEAASVVSAARYPPEGTRSVGVGRAHGYGPDFQGYMERANSEVAVVIQVEHIRAVHEIEHIVAVPGLDCVFVGPYDLSGSLGKPGEVNDPEVVSAMDHVRRVCSESGICLGAFGVTADAVKGYFEQGFRLLALSMDTLFLTVGASRMYKSVRDSVK